MAADARAKVSFYIFLTAQDIYELLLSMCKVNVCVRLYITNVQSKSIHRCSFG